MTTQMVKHFDTAAERDAFLKDAASKFIRACNSYTRPERLVECIYGLYPNGVQESAVTLFCYDWVQIMAAEIGIDLRNEASKNFALRAVRIELEFAYQGYPYQDEAALTHIAQPIDFTRPLVGVVFDFVSAICSAPPKTFATLVKTASGHNTLDQIITHFCHAWLVELARTEPGLIDGSNRAAYEYAKAVEALGDFYFPLI